MIGKRIKEERMKKNLSQEELGKIFSITQQAVNKWESGKSSPDPEMIRNLTDFFGCTADYLIGRTDDPTPPTTEDDPDSDLQPTPRDRIKTFQKKLGELSPKSLEFLEYQIERLHELDLEEIERRKAERKDQKK